MSHDPGSTELTEPPIPAPVHPALQAYQQRTRRAMRGYAAVLVLLVLLGFIAVRIAYAHGELNKVSASLGQAPAPIPVQATGTELTRAWQSTDHPAAGNPYADGIVVGYDAHTVNGRDALTGAVRWHYTRTDETICSVMQQDSSTIAIYDHLGNCDEVTGFVTATGQAKWYRTLTDDGQSSAGSAPNVVVTVAAQSVHVFDNAGGLDRWNWPAPDGCTVTRALAGSLGVLISYRCGSGNHLILRDEFKDTTTWTLDTTSALLPIAASAFVGAVDPATGQLHRYTGAKGTDSISGQLAATAAELTALPRVATSVSGTDSTGKANEFIFAGKLFCLSYTGAVAWSAGASSAPWLVGDRLVAAADGPGRVVQHREDGGAAQLTSRLSPAPAAGARPYPVGGGLLMSGTDLAMYR
ncbi:MAG: hypothetical protein ABI140_07065 [Jatrophihabitantaceae bacterium]